MKHAVLNPARDPRVEDPTNLWLVDPLAHLLLPLAVRLRISANAISVGGLFIGAAAAVAYLRWRQPGWAAAGLLISLAWLVADSLDGMVARATGTSSAFGRELDGLCDHGVFTLLYLALADSVGGGATWCLMVAAGLAHAVQSNLYEAERARFHRRLRGCATVGAAACSRNPASRLYHRVAACFDAASAPFDRALASATARKAAARGYARAAVPVLRLMVPLSQNMRLVAIFLACLLGHVTLFLWFELGPLSLLTAAGILWHRHVEAALVRSMTPADAT